MDQARLERQALEQEIKVEGFVHGYVHEHRVIVVVQSGHKMVVAKSAGIEVLV